MIVSFGDKATERFYHSGFRPPRMPTDIVKSAFRKLDMLNVAVQLVDLRSPPGNRLELLKGELAGFHSVRINDQWRVIFRWAPGEASDVRILDYHS